MEFLTFCLLAAAALGLFGAALLLPEYARLQQARYQLARQQATMARLRALTEGHERTIAELPRDAVLTKRLAMNELGYWPENEVVVLNDDEPAMHSPTAVAPSGPPAPAPPSGWVMAAAERVSDPPTRRGLILLAVVGLAAAVLLFPGGAKPRAAED